MSESKRTNKVTHISEYVDKSIKKISGRKKDRNNKREDKLKVLKKKYGNDVNSKQLTKQELKDWIKLFNKKRGN